MLEKEEKKEEEERKKEEEVEEEMTTSKQYLVRQDTCIPCDLAILFLNVYPTEMGTDDHQSLKS